MTNAILLYTGNVASTPTIEYVRSSGKVFVPVVEQFDEYLIEKHAGFKDNLYPFLCEVLEDMYSGKVHPYLLKSDLTLRNAGIDLSSYKHTIFKWRPFDESLNSRDRFIQMVSKFDVRPVVIRRESVVDQAIKVHLSEVTYGGRHQQFKAGMMTDVEYQEYISEQQNIRVHIDKDGLEKIILIARNFLQRSRRLIDRRNRLFSLQGSPDTVILTEDIYTPNLDADKFNSRFTGVFGENISADTSGKILTRKAGLELANCENYFDVILDEKLRGIQAKYEDIGWVR